jgi:hypothetical protein
MLPSWARSPQEVLERWHATCRKRNLREQAAFFVSLGWGARLCKLFAVACTRTAFAKRLNERGRALLDLVERRADDLSLQEELIGEVNAIAREIDDFEKDGWPDSKAYRYHTQVFHVVYGVAAQNPAWAAGSMAVRRHRELFGRILTAMVGSGWNWNDEWRTDRVVTLAGGIYDERAWERMPVLSDALADAGCDEPNLLGYCRGDGPFFRGCLVLDIILEKRIVSQA